MPCISCGYDLIGLDDAGPCPECGSRIAGSVMGEGLAFAGLTYLATVRRGLNLARLGVGLILGLAIGAFVLGIVWGLLVPWSTPAWVTETLVTLVSMAIFGVHAAGWWLSTTPDPRLADHARSRSGHAARWSAVAMAALTPCFVLASLILPSSLVLYMPALGLIALAHYAGSAAYLRVLSRRAGNARAARLARRTLIAVAVVLAGTLAHLLIDATGLAVPQGGAVGGVLGGLIGLLLSAVPIAAFVAAMVALVQQFTAAGLIRDDLDRFLFHARICGEDRTTNPAGP